MRERETTRPNLPTLWQLVAAALMLAMASAPAPARAADTLSSSYVTPFPENDKYRAYLFGDSLAVGLATALVPDLAQQNVEVASRAADGLGIARNDGKTWDQVVGEIPKSDSFQVAVVLVGVDDRVWMRLPKQRFDFGSPGWRQEYERRVDALITALRARNVAVYWVGLPIMRTEGASSAAQMVNSILLSRARLNGLKFVDSWDAFADNDGAYTDNGPDLSGKVRQLREQDGIHMTLKGYQKLANLVEREIIRDLAVAREERDVPLAGDVEEQGHVRDALQKPASGGGAAKSDAGKSSLADVPSEDSNVTLPLGPGGQSVAVTITRPTIPGAVMSQLLASREARQTDLGQTVAVDLVGDLTAMSSVVTSADAQRVAGSRVSLTDSPFYKLLIRGDSLQPRPGRVDDFSWPKSAAGSPG